MTRAASPSPDRSFRLDIADSIADARLPPRELYADDGVAAAAREAALRPSWQFLGESAGLEAAGAARPVTLLAGSLDEPLLLVRDGERKLRLLSNVCTHRGHLVCESAATLRALRCTYHGRGFDLAGRCTGAPGFEKAAGFPSEADALPTAALAEWRGLLFGSLAPATPFDEWIAPVERRLGPLASTPGAWRRETRHDRLFEFDANWCLYVENYLEGLHIPFIHPGLNAKLDWKSYRYENVASGTLQVGVAAAGEPVFELPRGHPDAAPAGSKAAAASVGALYFWLFPNLMLNFYPWGLSLNVVEPLGTARTRVRFHAFVQDPALHDRGAGSGLDQVEMEDERAAAQVQRGMASRHYRRGRYAPEAEAGVHWFHRMLARALAAVA
jgi:choline monooxygenase